MIHVLLFAELQERVGKDVIQLNETFLTVRELKEKMEQQFSLGDLHSVMVAVNEEYAIDEDPIKAGDTVALIPPVSGG